MKRRKPRDARQLVILTGLSGSGKSTVLKTFEDLGFYCVDNLPVALIPTFSELHMQAGGEIQRAALLVDAREGGQLEKLPAILHQLRARRSRRRWFSSKPAKTRCCGDSARRGGRIRWGTIVRCWRACGASAC